MCFLLLLCSLRVYAPCSKQKRYRLLAKRTFLTVLPTPGSITIEWHLTHPSHLWVGGFHSALEKNENVPKARITAKKCWTKETYFCSSQIRKNTQLYAVYIVLHRKKPLSLSSWKSLPPVPSQPLPPLWSPCAAWQVFESWNLGCFWPNLWRPCLESGWKTRNNRLFEVNWLWVETLQACKCEIGRSWHTTQMDHASRRNLATFR